MLEARVVESYFGQQRVAVELATPSGATLTLSRAHDAPALRTGEVVRVAIDARTLQFLEE